MFVDDIIALGAKARLLSVNLCSGNVDCDRGMPTDDDTLPIANVYVVSDVATPEGDERTGISRFIHETTLVVEIVKDGNHAREIKAWLSAVGEGVMQALLRDLDWAVDGDGDRLLEGVAGVRRGYDLPVENDRPIIRLQLQFRLLARSYWAPDHTDLSDLSTIGLAIPSNDDEPVIGATVTVPQP